jgi:hypothetical protein
VQGQAAAVFVLVVAAAEAAVALALLFAVYRTSKDIDLERRRSSARDPRAGCRSCSWCCRCCTAVLVGLLPQRSPGLAHGSPPR